MDHDVPEAEPGRRQPTPRRSSDSTVAHHTSSDGPGTTPETERHERAVAEMMEFLGLTPQPGDDLSPPTTAFPSGGDSRLLEAETGPSPSIGKYLVVEPLGEGGQGQVFRVLHPGLGNDLVLKLSRRSFA